MKKHVPAILALVIMLLLIAVGCSSGPEQSQDTQHEQGIGVLNNDLEGGNYSINTVIDEAGGASPVEVRMVYSTSYDIESWRITDSKTLRIRVELVRAPENTEVYIEHLHADVNIQSTQAEIDGLQQDSMDDYLHSGDQPGFIVTREFPYEEEFSIDGYSETLISGWEFQNGQYGRGEIDQERLTECNLRELGARFSQFTLVYDVVMGNPEEGYHKSIVSNQLRVPISTSGC